eukprot:4913811-Prymnesium_polylepis.1
MTRDPRRLVLFGKISDNLGVRWQNAQNLRSVQKVANARSDGNFEFAERGEMRPESLPAFDRSSKGVQKGAHRPVTRAEIQRQKIASAAARPSHGIKAAPNTFVRQNIASAAARP